MQLPIDYINLITNFALRSDVKEEFASRNGSDTSTRTSNYYKLADSFTALEDQLELLWIDSKGKLAAAIMVKRMELRTIRRRIEDELNDCR